MASNRMRHPIKMPAAVLKTTRPKLFRRASITSWGKNDLRMTRVAADVNLKEFMLTVQQQKYEDRDKAAQREVSRAVSLEHQEKIRQQTERRTKWLQRSREKKDFIVNWEREGRSRWNANQAALCRYERRLLSYELAVRAIVTARQRISKARNTTEEIEGVQWFEKNLDRLGINPDGNFGGAKGRPGSEASALSSYKETEATFRSRLLRMVLEKRLVPSSNFEIMADIRFKGNARRRGCREREYQRFKTEEIEKRAKKEADAKRAADSHLTLMLQNGRGRREIAALFWGKKRVNEDKAATRRERSIGMSTRAHAAFETAFNARVANTHARHAVLIQEREKRSQALQARRDGAREGKRRRADSLCAQVAQKLVDFAVIVSETRASQGGAPLSPTMWRNLNRWFCSAEPFFPEENLSEFKVEPLNPYIEAKSLLESRNLDRCEGSWRPRGTTRKDFPPSSSRLDEIVSVARDLAWTTEPAPREAPMYKAFPSGDDGSDNGRISLSVRLVLLGKRKGLSSLCAELGRWTHLYVCSLDTALKCALEVGADVTASDGKGAKGRKKSVARASVSNSKSKVAGDHSGTSSVNSSALKSADGKEAIARSAFDPDASETHVTAFKEAAVAYHALRTHPKKGANPVSVATTVDLVVKHLSCRAPKGRGWLLIDFPKTLLESKLFEHALSGYTDDDVEAELGVDRGKKTRNKKSKAIPPETLELQVKPRSGLDAIMNLVETFPDSDGRACQANGEMDAKVGIAETSGSSEGVGIRAEEITRDQGYKEDDFVGNGPKGDVTTVDAAETLACRTWWEAFEGGHLVCDVRDDTNDERFLETLFLLANAAQKIKNESQASHQKEASTEQRSTQGTVQSSTSSGEESAEPLSEGNAVEDRLSPLASPLMVMLEDLRSKRRASMSRATRIRFEALAGERDLDLQGVRSVIGQVDSTATGYTCVWPLHSTRALRDMESVCEASSVTHWATDVEYTFWRGLRSPDDRWTAACIRLEDELADWLVCFDKTAAFKRENGRNTVGLSRVSGGDYKASPGCPTTPEENDRVWEALEEFELEAGNVSDDRHAAYEAIMSSVESEADQRVQRWIETAARSATELCQVEREKHHEVVRTLRDLHRLIGLSHDSSVDGRGIESSARAAIDALARDLAAMSEQLKGFNCGSRGLEDEVHFSIEEVYLQADYLAESNKADSSSDIQASAAQHAIVPAGLGATESDGATPQSLSSAPLGPSLNEETKGADCVREISDRSLATAMWRSSETHASRLRGIISRLGIAMDRCKAAVASMLAALRHLKRRRMQLEHEAITTASAIVMRGLEEFDLVAVQGILQKGIPLMVKDNETFAADPRVELSWGLSSLGLAQIASLAHALRSTLPNSGSGCGTPDSIVSAADLARTVLSWSRSTANDHSRSGSSADEIPVAWTDGSGGYVEALCRAIGWGTEADGVPWRRLIHCLLLGHVRSSPTLEDLRSMRCHFTRETEAYFSRPESAGVTTGAAGGVPAASDNVVGILQWQGRQEQGKEQQSEQELTSQMTLHLMQRQFQIFPFWFERQGGEYAKERTADGEGRATELDGKMVQTDTVMAEEIKAVYAETWGDGDGQVDGMDLLLTLCAVPGACSFESTPAPQNIDEVNCGNDGIPFSPGLFRAFTMLADAPPSASSLDLATGAINASEAVPNIGSSYPTTSSQALVVSRDDRSVLQERSAGDPLVTVSMLRVILEHGSSLSPTEVSSSVHEAMSKAARENTALEQNFNSSYGPKIITVSMESAGDMKGHESRDKGYVEEEADERGEFVSESMEQGDEEDCQSIRFEASKDKQKNDAAEGSATIVREPRRNREENPVGFAAGEQARVKSDEPKQEREPMISFSNVCECETVRAWLRKGAYSLPSFEVTSGRRIISAGRLGCST